MAIDDLSTPRVWIEADAGVVVQLIFEDDNYVIYEFIGENSDDLWITFSVGAAVIRLGESFIQRISQSGLFIVSKSFDMYQEGVFPTIAGEITARARADGKRVIVFGSSMGAFGALNFSADLHATHVISAGPPVCMTPNIVGSFDTRWANVDPGSKLAASDSRNVMSRTAQISVLYDPMNAIDRGQFALLKDFPNVQGYTFPTSGHGCFHTLNHAGILEPLLPELLKPREEIDLYMSANRRGFKTAIRGTLDYKFAMAEWYFNRKRMSKAAPWLWKVLEENPNFGPACDYMLVCLESVARGGRDATPEFIRLIDLLITKSLCSKSQSALECAFSNLPNSAPLKHIAAIVELKAGNYEAAITYFDEAIAMFSGACGWYIEAAYTARLAGELAKCRYYIEQAGALFPEDASVQAFEHTYLTVPNV